MPQWNISIQTLRWSANKSLVRQLFNIRYVMLNNHFLGLRLGGGHFLSTSKVLNVKLHRSICKLPQLKLSWCPRSLARMLLRAHCSVLRRWCSVRSPMLWIGLSFFCIWMQNNVWNYIFRPFDHPCAEEPGVYARMFEHGMLSGALHAWGTRIFAKSYLKAWTRLGVCKSWLPIIALPVGLPREFSVMAILMMA